MTRTKKRSRNAGVIAAMEWAVTAAQNRLDQLTAPMEAAKKAAEAAEKDGNAEALEKAKAELLGFEADIELFDRVFDARTNLAGRQADLNRQREFRV